MTCSFPFYFNVARLAVPSDINLIKVTWRKPTFEYVLCIHFSLCLFFECWLTVKKKKKKRLETLFILFHCFFKAII